MSKPTILCLADVYLIALPALHVAFSSWQCLTAGPCSSDAGQCVLAPSETIHIHNFPLKQITYDNFPLACFFNLLVSLKLIVYQLDRHNLLACSPVTCHHGALFS